MLGNLAITLINQRLDYVSRNPLSSGVVLGSNNKVELQNLTSTL